MPLRVAVVFLPFPLAWFWLASQSECLKLSLKLGYTLLQLSLNDQLSSRLVVGFLLLSKNTLLVVCLDTLTLIQRKQPAQDSPNFMLSGINKEPQGPHSCLFPSCLQIQKSKTRQDKNLGVNLTRLSATPVLILRAYFHNIPQLGHGHTTHTTPAWGATPARGLAGHWSAIYQGEALLIFASASAAWFRA